MLWKYASNLQEKICCIFSEHLFLRTILTDCIWVIPSFSLIHCVKSVQIRNFFWSVFPAFGQNTERYTPYLSVFTPYLSVFSPNARKYGPEKTPYLDTFHAVISSTNQQQFRHSVLYPSVGSSSAILMVFVILLIFLFPVWRVLSVLTLLEKSNQTVPKIYLLDRVHFGLWFRLSSLSHPSQLHFRQ